MLRDYRKTNINRAKGPDDSRKYVDIFPDGYCMLIMGSPGTYKSSIAWWLTTKITPVIKNRKYLLIEENNDNFKIQLRSLGLWTDDKDENNILLSVPFIDPKSELENDLIFPEDNMKELFQDRICEILSPLKNVKEHQGALFVIDSINSLIDYCRWKPDEARQKICSMINIYRDRRVSSILISEDPSINKFLQYFADIIVQLEINENQVFITYNKFRGEPLNYSPLKVKWKEKGILSFEYV